MTEPAGESLKDGEREVGLPQDSIAQDVISPQLVGSESQTSESSHQEEPPTPSVETNLPPTTQTDDTREQISAESATNQPPTEEKGNEPHTPLTPMTGGQIGGMFSRLRKAWQGTEPKVSHVLHIVYILLP